MSDNQTRQILAQKAAAKVCNFYFVWLFCKLIYYYFAEQMPIKICCSYIRKQESVVKEFNLPSSSRPFFSRCTSLSLRSQATSCFSFSLSQAELRLELPFADCRLWIDRSCTHRSASANIEVRCCSRVVRLETVL